MLAEIFLLRLQTKVRAAARAPIAAGVSRRFVPFAPAGVRFGHALGRMG